MNEVSSNCAQVAVIIPVRNRPDFLRDCLNSLTKQDFPTGHCEVIVCDDHSEEDLEQVIERFRLHLPKLKLLRQQKPRGPAAARNMGFRSSSAAIFVCLDSDIVCNPSFLKELLGTLKANPHWVGAEAALIPNQVELSPLWDAPACDRGGRYHTAAIAYRRDAVFKAGGFDETFKLAACEDVDLAARLFEHGTIGFASDAKALHPLRKVTLLTHWQWRRSWKYITILAKRYGFLAFPGRQTGRFPRVRVAVAAVITQPLGRFLEACKYLKQNFRGGITAGLYALFDVICGLIALPVIFFSTIPPRRNYLEVNTSPGENFLNKGCQVDQTLKKVRCLYISRFAPERTQTDPYTGLPWYLSRHTSFIGLWNKPSHKSVPFKENCDQLVEVRSGIMGWLEKFLRTLKMAMASTRPDAVVCGIDEPSLILGVLLGILRKVRVFALVEDPPFTGRYERFTGFVAKVERRLRTRLLHHLLENCTGIFCFIEKDVLKEFVLHKTQIYQMMNGVSSLARDFSENRPHTLKSNGEYIIGLVGALTPEQGLDTLLRIIGEVRRHIPHLRLRLIGPMDPGYKTDFRATLKRFDLDLATEVTGWLSYTKMLEHLRGCTVGVYCNPPTDWFRIAHPLKVCEYLALGKATIAWDYPGVRRLLDGGRLGILVPSGNLSAFAEALISMGNPEYRRLIEKEISRAVQDHWTSEYWYHHVLSVIANPAQKEIDQSFAQG